MIWGCQKSCKPYWNTAGVHVFWQSYEYVFLLVSVQFLPMPQGDCMILYVVARQNSGHR